MHKKVEETAEQKVHEKGPFPPKSKAKLPQSTEIFPTFCAAPPNDVGAFSDISPLTRALTPSFIQAGESPLSAKPTKEG